MNHIDLTGLKCPEPMMMLRRTVRKMSAGEELKILADDPSTTRDFPKFCEFQNHTMVSMNTESETYEYVIKKG
ncbi:sulfurtransferase TusA [Vibrio owensii]|uniref:sulfurtransferase TusA n=1 Tax=Vibrio owensii TaxID=696485 RepID=UPI0018F1E266|nr:sulfurtransferase TusA [Vibrio owensii]